MLKRFKNFFTNKQSGAAQAAGDQKSRESELLTPLVQAEGGSVDDAASAVFAQAAGDQNARESAGSMDGAASAGSAQAPSTKPQKKFWQHWDDSMAPMLLQDVRRCLELDPANAGRKITSKEVVEVALALGMKLYATVIDMGAVEAELEAIRAQRQSQRKEEKDSVSYGKKAKDSVKASYNKVEASAADHLTTSVEEGLTKFSSSSEVESDPVKVVGDA